MSEYDPRFPLEIVEWGKHFENNRSKTVQEARWVPVPNRHDGLKFSRMMTHKDAAMLFSAWILIVQVASKCPKRGVLTNGEGAPLTPEDIAFITRAPRRWFDIAIPYLLGIQWVKQTIATTLTPDCQSTGSQLTLDCQSGVSPMSCERQDDASSRARAEWNGMEGKGNPPAVPQGDQDADPQSAPSEPVAETAKKRICRILGRDPRRPLPFDAQAELGRLCPIPETEFELIEWFYGLPEPSEPELYKELTWRRRDVGKLITHWTEEVDRARAYREKNGGEKKEAAKKKEPAGWLEWRQATYPACDISDSFWRLTPDVQREYWAFLKQKESEEK